MHARSIVSRPLLSVLVLALATLALGHRALFLERDNSPSTFFTADASAERTYREMVGVFGGDELVLLRLVGARVDTPAHLRALAKAECALRQLEGVVTTLSPISGGFFGSGSRASPCVLPSDEALEKESLVGLAKEVAALRAYRKLALVSEEPAALGIIATVVMRGPDARLNLMRATDALCARLHGAGLRAEVVSLATANGAIDLEIRRSLARFLPLVVLLCLLIGLLIYRSLAAMLAILLPVGGAVLIGASYLELVGETMNIVTGVMPPLVLAVGFAAGLHLLAHYRRAKAEGLADVEAAAWAWREKRAPIAFAVSTTALAFGSLSLSGIGSISALGQSAAVALFAALILVLLGVPPLLVLLAPRLPGKDHARGEKILAWGAALGARKRWIVIALVAGAVLASAWGIGRLRVSFDGFDLLPADAPARVRYQRMERAGVGLGNVDIWLKRPVADRRELVALAPRIARFAASLEGRHGISGVFGPNDILRAINYRLRKSADLPSSLDAFDIAASESTKRRFDELLALFWQKERGVKLTLLTLTRDDSTVAARARAIERSLAAHFPGSKAVVSGHFSMLIGTPRLLVETLAKSLALTVGVVTLLFALVFRRWRLVLAAMLINTLPVLVVFGVMGAWGARIDVATVMTGSVIFGVAVDDTFHYLFHFRHRASLAEAARATGEGIVATTLVLAGGFMVLVASSLVPITRFGVLTALGVTLALLTDALVLPALLSVSGAKEQP